jgi:hypothetical protein
MGVSLPNPSSRLVRAAAAEQADLTRHRERLTRERSALLARVRERDDALTIIDQRLAVLGRLIEEPAPDSHPDGVDRADSHPDGVNRADSHPDGADPADSRRGGVPGAAARDVSAPPPSEPDGCGEHDRAREPTRQILRGPAIREVAVQVLIANPERIDALHYRRWYELVQEAGYSVAGKDPLAVFLTQVSRSPVVRKTTKPGVYEVDRQAPLRIRRRLERLQSELREVTVAPQPPIELADVRARRHELDVAISQQERALEEALRTLRCDERGDTAAGSTGTG